MHIYVDRDVTVTLADNVSETKTWTSGGITITENYTVVAYTLNLKRGWNAVHLREAATGTFHATSETINATITMFTEDPDRQLRWLALYEWGVSPGAEALSRSGRAQSGRARALQFRER